MNLRLNKILAQSGVASRRKADQLIAQGRVCVDGEPVCELGTQVDPRKHEITVDGVPLNKAPAKPRYFLFNKPKGVVSTLSDPEGRRHLKDFLPPKERLFPVGRLEYHAEGLLLLTNDGDLAQRLTHPRYGVTRTYLVKVEGKPDGAALHRVRQRLKNARIYPERQTRKNCWYRVTLSQSRGAEIPRLWLQAGHPVIKLTRTEFAGLYLKNLPTGAFRSLTPKELALLKDKAGK